MDCKHSRGEIFRPTDILAQHNDVGSEWEESEGEDAAALRQAQDKQAAALQEIMLPALLPLRGR